jgi:predicted negative regulator of RcsB-dependent stress response
MLAASSTVQPTVRGADLNADVPAYQDVVRQYRAGDVAGAVRLLESWDEARLQKTVGVLWPVPKPNSTLDRRDVDDISAACLLHLDVLVRHPGQPAFEALHTQIIRGYLARLRGVDAASLLTIDLHLALAIHMEAQLKLEALQLFFDEIGGTYASQGALLLAEGRLHEVLASRRLEAARRAVLVPSSRKSLERAERLLRRALAVAPQLAEAHLRLARVSILQGRPEEGVSLLQTVLAGSRDSDTRYLAYLFIGQAQRGAGRLALAGTAFAAAAAERPCGQAAAMALAHAAFSEGRYEDARGILTTTLKRSDGCIDPWTVYDFGQAPGLPGFIAALRGALRP